MQQVSYGIRSISAAVEPGEDVYSNISRVLVKQILALQETLAFYELHFEQPAPVKEPACSCPNCGLPAFEPGAMETSAEELTPDQPLM